MVKSQAGFQRMQEDLRCPHDPAPCRGRDPPRRWEVSASANIALVSVTEPNSRDRARMAIGVMRGQLQFLVEALLLTLLGGAGASSAVVPLVALSLASRATPCTFSGTAVGLAMLIAVVIGLVFGFFRVARPRSIPLTRSGMSDHEGS